MLSVMSKTFEFPLSILVRCSAFLKKKKKTFSLKLRERKVFPLQITVSCHEINFLRKFCVMSLVRKRSLSL